MDGCELIEELLRRLIDLVEDAVVVKVLGLHFVPAAKDIVNRKERELGELAQLFFA